MHGHTSSTISSIARTDADSTVPGYGQFNVCMRQLHPKNTTGILLIFSFQNTADDVGSLRGPGGKSDTYTWREIFHLYAEAEAF